MSNDYVLLRSVLDLENEMDVKIAEVLSSMQKDESSTKTPEAAEESEEYMPESGADDSGGGGGGGESSEEPMCARFFYAKKGKIPQARMKRCSSNNPHGVYNQVIWKQDTQEKVSYMNTSKIKNPIDVEKDRPGFFYWANIDIPANKQVMIPTITADNWVSSYTTLPENIHVDFFKDEVDQIFVLSPTNIRLKYTLGIPVFIRDVYMHGPGSKTRIRNIKISDMKNHKDYKKNIGKMSPEIYEEVKKILKKVSIPDVESDDLETWVSGMLKLFSKEWYKNKNNPCNHMDGKKYPEIKREFDLGDNTFNPLLMKQGVCRHRASIFFVMATYFGIPCRYVGNDCHAFVEVWVPDIGWNIYDLGGCAPPSQDDDDKPLDPDQKLEEETPQMDQPTDDKKPPQKDKNLLSKQIDAIAKKLSNEGWSEDDIKNAIQALYEDSKIHKRKRYF